MEGIRYSYEEALSVFHNRTASSSGFLYFTPQSHSGDFTLKPLVYNDILIFLRQQNSPALCKYIDEYFNDIITKKIHIRQTWSVAAAFLTVLDGFITECSQRETLFPLLENALNTYQNCQSALQLKQLLQSTCKAVLDSLADEKDPEKQMELKRKANRKVAEMVQKEASATLKKVLYELSNQMKNSYARSDV